MKLKQSVQGAFLTPRRFAFLILMGILCLTAPARADTVTYYFNAYNAANPGSWAQYPERTADGSTGTYGRDNVNGHYVQFTGNTCPGTDLGAISAVEVRIYWAGNIQDLAYPRLIPYFGGSTAAAGVYQDNTRSGSDEQYPYWSGYFDITSDANAPGSWTWSDVQNLDLRLQLVRNGNGRVLACKVELRVTYGAGGNSAPATPNIDNFDNGACTSDTTPTLQFDLTDPDAGDIVKYQLQIDDNTSFTNPLLLDYTEASGSAVPRSDITYTPSALSEGAYYWRVKGIDDEGAESGWATANGGSAAFYVDLGGPTAPGSLSEASKTTSSVTLNFGAQTTEANFDTYKIFSKQGASGVTESDTQHTNSSLAYIDYYGGSSITINSLQPATQYVFNIWAYDKCGNKASATEVSVTTESGEPDPDPEPLPVSGCGTNSVTANYSDGFDAAELDLINTEVDGGQVVLKTGFAAIDKENIVIPFEQEIFVNMLYVAGINDIGFSLYDEIVDGSDNFIGFDNIPLEKRHAFFRNTMDQPNGGNGIFDSGYGLGNFPYNNEAALATYDDGTGRLFLVDGDGTVTPRDMRKSLGTFAGGTELVFWMVKGWPTATPQHYDDAAFSADGLRWIWYNKYLWNDDAWPFPDHPAVDCVGPGYTPFYKEYLFDVPTTEGVCHLSGGWLKDTAFDRLFDNFGLQLAAGSYQMPITPGEKYPHFIVGAPADDPNAWVLGIEQNHFSWIGSSDVDANDFVFIIERKTGGTVELKADQPITSGSVATFTGVTLEVWDYIPCLTDTEITYALSIDNGATWVTLDGWDEVNESAADKSIGDPIDPAVWTPGTPAYTYRSRRVDFSALGLTGNEIRWRATLFSKDAACEPKIVDLAISSTVMGGGEVSRASPMVKANLLYSGSYGFSDGSWADDTPRGHLKTTRIYDPADPTTTTGDPVWDAGEELNDKSPVDRKIYIADVTITAASGEQVGTGDGTTTVFAGTLSGHPIVAGSLSITDGNHETFTDTGVSTLVGNLGGSGTINRYTGEFSITFNTAPVADVPVTASYQYFNAAYLRQEFKTANANVTTDMLGIDNTFVIGEGYTYDFDGDGTYEADDDRAWLIEWVRGYKNPINEPGVEKEWKLGAVDHSVPAVQTPPAKPSWFFGTATTEAERDSFESFMSANSARRTIVYVGARDGMLHAFDGGDFRYGDNSATAHEEHRGYFNGEDYGTGEEKWAWIPNNLLPRLKNNVLLEEDQAYVDASPALADVFVNGDWKTVLITAQGNGGDTIFCLDVTDPLSPSFMWEFADPELFRSRSSPSIGKIGRILVEGQAKWVAFFVSGKTYNANLYPSIYIIDVSDGSLVHRVFLNDEVSGGPSGRGGVLSGQPTPVDSDGNGYIDRLYIGSDKGYLYKVNIPDDPDVPKYSITNCAINGDFDLDSGESINDTIAGSGWHPIYGSPVVYVQNGVDAEGALTYDIRLLFGTGDSPYFDEDIDMNNTRYHFFAYRDQTKKGVCDDSQVFLDWFIELDMGHRIFSSAFAAAGLVYFGTATSETEDPCEGPSTTGLSSLGDIYAYDIKTGVQAGKVENVGNTVITPIVVDQHLYMKSQTADVKSFGTGRYNNSRAFGGSPKVEIRSWYEIF